MKKYIICISSENVWNASSKAREDIEALAVRSGYERIVLGGEKTSDGSLSGMLRLVRDTYVNWSAAEKAVEPGSVLLIQYPHYPMKASLILRHLLPRMRRRKNVTLVALIHDLNSVRESFGWAARYSDRHLLRQFDRIICHNECMKGYLTEKGFDARRLVCLDVFDYLTDCPIRERRLSDGVTVAGNLSPEKCGYITDMLGLLDGKLNVNLYGNGFEPNESYRTVAYRGAYPPSELPGVLEGAFGLVWDGASAESCTGLYGEYLRINNPHKVSLYIASGMPVIIWDEAALAGFVVDNGLGIAISSIDDIPDRLSTLSEDEYAVMLKNTERFARLFRGGHYFNAASTL